MQQGAAVIAATPVTDTIKQVDGAGTITATPDRSWLWAAQTPQGFPVQQLRAAHATATEQGWSVTDDAALFERLGLAVQVLEAPASNIKLTTPSISPWQRRSLLRAADPQLAAAAIELGPGT